MDRADLNLICENFDFQLPREITRFAEEIKTEPAVIKSGRKRCSKVAGSMVNCIGEQGWRSGESARLPPMCPGFDSRTRRHMWTEFVGSLSCSERFFSENSDFPLFAKTNI